MVNGILHIRETHIMFPRRRCVVGGLRHTRNVRCVQQHCYHDTHTNTHTTAPPHPHPPRSLHFQTWPESTDPQKFVYEEMSIAAFLLELWARLDREPTADAPPFKYKFADLGCGNGLLTFFLTAEGYTGYGVDLRRRRLWDVYDPMPELREEPVLPNETLTLPECVAPATRPLVLALCLSLLPVLSSAAFDCIIGLFCACRPRRGCPLHRFLRPSPPPTHTHIQHGVAPWESLGRADGLDSADGRRLLPVPQILGAALLPVLSERREVLFDVLGRQGCQPQPSRHLPALSRLCE